jgi:hypothetical protein
LDLWRARRGFARVRTGGDGRDGRYRVEVHNWAGPPANTVDLKLTFFNSAGEPGPGG